MLIGFVTCAEARRPLKVRGGIPFRDVHELVTSSGGEHSRHTGPCPVNNEMSARWNPAASAFATRIVWRELKVISGLLLFSETWNDGRFQEQS